MRFFQRNSEFWDFSGMKALLYFSVILCTCLFALIPTVAGKKCPGKCIYNVTDCKANGGKIAGYCTNELACCDYSFKKMGSCGSNMSMLTTAIFRSPEYPEYSHGDLVCPFNFEFAKNATGIIVEFTDILMDGMGFVKHSSCESDMILLKGFPNWTPPAQCGNLTNYAAVIDLGSRLTKGMKSLTILALMSSNKYKWQIKVTQLYQDRKKPIIKKMMDEDTTETSAKHDDDDDDDEDSSTEHGPYQPPKLAKIEDDSQYDNEQAELYRIMQLASSPKAQKVSIAAVESGMINGGEDGQDYSNYPEEETFIVNGDDTQISAVPWQASLRSVVSAKHAKYLPQLKLKNCTIDEGIHFCGGSIISDSHVLTATHCFLVGEKLITWQTTSTIKIVLGDSHLCDENKDGIQEFKAEKIYYHYAYDTSAILNDVVVIKLDRKIRFTSKIQPIKLAEEGMQFENQYALASGWGLTNLTSAEKAKTPDQLQSADDMFIGNSSYCMKEQLRLYPKMKSQSLTKYPKYGDVFSSLLCTYIRNGSLPRVVGQGDSGGPLVVFSSSSGGGHNTKYSKGKSKNKTKPGDESSSSGKKERLLVGVISYMIPIPHDKKEHDVSNYVDFYQSVSYYRRWIDLAMQ